MHIPSRLGANTCHGRCRQVSGSLVEAHGNRHTQRSGRCQQVSGSLVETHGNRHTQRSGRCRQLSAGVAQSFGRCRQVSIAVLAGVGRCHKKRRQVLAPSMIPSLDPDTEALEPVPSKAMAAGLGQRGNNRGGRGDRGREMKESCCCPGQCTDVCHHFVSRVLWMLPS